MMWWTRLGVAVMSISVFWASPSATSAETVRTWEETITIPTYPWQPEDVNPHFREYEGRITYPYSMQDDLSATKVDRRYKAICLENEYLKVICLPELGGRIHSVLDKTTNQQMFHLNQVIKPGLIAMRGAWISGGIEWNAGPQGHTVSIVSPVDVTAVQHQDGSASLVIGNTDKILRIRWTARLTLRPGKAFLEEDLRIFNPHDGVHPYYFWNNTAFPCNKGTRFIYPMSLGTDHSAEKFFTWPIYEGRDMTWLKNYPDMTSIFAWNCAFDFFGAYEVDLDRGIVQYADRGVLPGKKAWTWGQADFGLVSQEALTDEDGPYIEVQSGPLATQSDYEFLMPRQEVAWQEWWYPVHGLGDGFEYATRDVVIQSLRNDGDSVELRILGTGVFQGARCVVKDGATVLAETSLDLSPLAPQVVRVPSGARKPLSVNIRDSQGAVLAAYTTPLPIPPVSPPPAKVVKSEDTMTVEELYVAGLRSDKDTNPSGARAWYEKAVAKDPSHAPSLVNLAILDIESGLYEAAVGRLESALKRRPDDSVAWAFLGVAQLRLERYPEAMDCGYRAARLISAASLGFDVAGRARWAMGEHKEAIKAFRQALWANPRDDRASDHLILALLLDRQEEEARRLAKERYAKDPLAVIPMAVAYSDSPETILEKLRSLGEVEFMLMDAASVCTDLRSYELAAMLLYGGLQSKASPLARYHLAYYLHMMNDDGRAVSVLKEAASMSPDYMFPSFTESLPVLKYATEKNPQDANAHFLLGNLYAGLGRLDEAVMSWTQAVRLAPTLGVAQRCLAIHAWKKENDLNKAEALFAKAIEARPNDETYYRDRAAILVALDRKEEAIELLAKRPVGERPRTDATILHVRTLVELKRYDEALVVLSTSDFANWEGQADSWNLFNRALIERGKLRFEAKDYPEALKDFETALTYPKNLRVGRPVKPREAEAQYWRGRTLQALNRLDDAKAAWIAGAAGDDGPEEQNRHRDLCAQALELTSNP